jgi:Heterokaryon incompatibility protein (HET)
LSYIWGASDDDRLLLKKANKSELLLKNSFILYRKRIPATILDAIEFVRKIGERYLWVDSLCRFYETYSHCI